MRKLLVIALLVSLLAGLFSSCSSQKNSSLKVRIAYFPNITHSQALLGKANGSFQKAFGNENPIEWKMFNAGPSEIEALFAGGVDIGYIGPGPAINGYVKSNGDLQIIAGAADAGAILVSRSGLVIKDIKELSGKRVAVPQFGNTQDLSLRSLLQENGLKDTAKGGTVEIKQVQNPDVKALFERKELDAALVPEPWGSLLIKEAKANVVLDYNQVWKDGKYPTAVIIARKEFIDKHPDLAEKFIKTHVELSDYIINNLEKSKEIINKQIAELTKKPLSKDILDASFKRVVISVNPEKDAIEALVQLSVSTGILKERPNTDKLYNLDILNKVLKEKGQSQIK